MSIRDQIQLDQTQTWLSIRSKKRIDAQIFQVIPTGWNG